MTDAKGFGEDLPSASVWDRFDFIGVAGYIPNRDRERKLRKRLARVGCTRAHWHYEFPNPFTPLLAKALKLGAGMGAGVGPFSCTMNHYYNLKVAQGFDCGNAILMENDVLFLKDDDIFAEVLSSIPGDADVALLDWFRGRATTDDDLARLRRKPRVNGHWAEANDLTLVSFGMVYFSRKGIDWLVANLERGASPRNKVRSADTFFRPRFSGDVRIYAAFPHAAIQGDEENGIHTAPKQYGIDVDKGNYE